MKIFTKASRVLLVAGIALTALTAQANSYQQLRTTTVANAKSMANDTWVSVTGKIIRSLGSDKYELKDATGIIRVEIDDDFGMPSQLVGKTVTIVGEMDVKRIGGVEIDAENIRFH